MEPHPDIGGNLKSRKRKMRKITSLLTETNRGRGEAIEDSWNSEKEAISR
jgi:hypothetical protein